ncbi:MAG: helix-turn-helix domain-containing protein [Micrococcales bacterium]|nr:helix-turn-helix domain-containing protein [Micrococcales bacterium]
MEYTARVELASRDVDGCVDPLMDAMEGYAPSVSTTPADTAQVTVTVVATSVRQAASQALALAEAAGVGAVTGIEVLPADEYDRRPWAIPELLSVTQAAATLGVTRQAVLGRLERGTLRGRLVGSTWVVAAEELAGL